MSVLVLVRHGQSTWNAKNVFTGWRDPPLSPQGEQEARNAARALAAKDFHFHSAFTSSLGRAQKTCDIILDGLGQSDLPVSRDPALNERDYGDLAGLNKDKAREQFGAAQVHRWRRSYEEAPPSGESLQDTKARVMAYYTRTIAPLLKNKDDAQILVVAHGNSLRALLMELEHLNQNEIVAREVPTGEPMLYHFDGADAPRREVISPNPNEPRR